ncbi:MAG: AMP-binding protein [Planctomycetota bacterium]|jgi:1-acyl-sn-glycerol-3-phosphate acyltransferase
MDKDAVVAGPAAEQLLAIIRELALELHPHRREVGNAGLDALLERDFGIDSLARVELTLRIERAFSVRLPEELVTAAETPSELIRAIEVADQTPAAKAPTSVPPPAPVPHEASAPERAGTLVEVLEFHAARHPERPHVHLLSGRGEESILTYGALWESSRSLAAGLRDRGLEPGRCVAIMLPTGAGFFEAYLGTLLAGGVPVPIYPPFRRSAIGEHLRRQAGILSSAQVPVLIATEDTRAFGRLIHAQVETLRHLVTVEDLEAGAGEPGRPQLRPENLALVQYTSGSTGDPKGVMLSHANLLANIRSLGRALDVNSADSIVSWLPLYHDMGLIGAWMGSLYHACPLILMRPLSFIGRPQRWLEAIHRYRATISAAPNFAYEHCCRRIEDDAIEGLDLGSWRLAGNGAEAVSPQTVRRFCERFAAYGFKAEAMTPMYGLAESAVALTTTPSGRGVRLDSVDRDRLMREGRAHAAAGEGAMELVSSGMPIPGHEVRIVDPTGREVAERVQGRIQFRGPSSTLGYLRNPAKTAALISDGWLGTGDFGYVAAGELYVTGRVKDMIVRAGRNVFPEEIEEAVGAIDGVRAGRVAVFPSSGQAHGTEGLIVLAESRLSDPEARAALRERIDVIVADCAELPPDDVVLGPPGSVLKTLNGKIRRADCARLYEEGRIGEREPAVWRQLLRVARASAGPVLRRALRATSAFAFAAWYWVTYRVLAPFTWLGVVLLPGLTARRRLARGAARLFLRLVGAGPVVRGLDRLPGDGPAVVVANHGSVIDGLILTAALPARFAFIAKSELIESRVARPFLKALGTAFVERFDPKRGVEDTRTLAELLEGGQPLAFFPEGTLDRRPGLRSFEMGAFVVAAQAGVPVVPVGIHGSRSLLRSGGSFPRRSLVTVAIASPLEPVGADWNAALRLRDEARAAILERCGEPDLVYEPKPILEDGKKARARGE